MSRAQFFQTGLLILTAFLGEARAAESLTEADLSPGTVSEISWPDLPYPLVVFVPDNYETGAGAARIHPVLFYYHGTSGRPNVGFVRHHTRGRDWIVVGMTYRSTGRFQYSKESLAKEMDVYRGLRIGLSRRLRIDSARTYVGGFSKGGWVSALFLEEDPLLAGGLVMGAGVLNRNGETGAPESRQPKAVYIGVGESDGNFALSHKARDFFGQLEDSTTLDVWPEIGHSMPAEAKFLRQWLRVEAGGGVAMDPEDHPAQADAIQWFDRELRRIRKKEQTAIDRYIALKQLAAAPFAKLADREALDEAKKLYAETVSDPMLAQEREAERGFFAILKRETQDLFLETLVRCHHDYSALAKDMPDTWFGQRARTSEERTGRLLGPHPPR